MLIALSTVVVMSNLLSLEQRRQKVTEPVIDPWGKPWFSAIVEAATFVEYKLKWHIIE